jgi:hypothetical protein
MILDLNKGLQGSYLRVVASISTISLDLVI